MMRNGGGGQRDISARARSPIKYKPSRGHARSPCLAVSLITSSILFSPPYLMVCTQQRVCLWQVGAIICFSFKE